MPSGTSGAGDRGGAAARQGILLAIDAALSAGGTVAVIHEDRLLAESETAMRGETSERLMPAIADALTAAGAGPRDLAHVVCGAGPGSFTSLRIAGSLAKGLAVAASAPLHEVSSLALIVAGARRPPPAGRYLAALDALRGEHFAQLVDWDGERVRSVGPLERHPSADLENVARSREARTAGPGMALPGAPQARGVLAMRELVLAESVDLERWEPLYGRPAEAQARWEAAHGRPLPGT